MMMMMCPPMMSSPAPSDSPLRTRAAKRRCNDPTPSSDSAPEPACAAKRPASTPTPDSSPAPVPPSTPMDCCPLVSAHVRDLLSCHHSSDTHVGLQDYTSGTIRVAFDLGRLTYRIIKESRSLESDRYHAYLTGTITPPDVSSFATAATVLPPLPPDVVPASFPAPC